MIATMMLASLAAATPARSAEICEVAPRLVAAVAVDTLRGFYESAATYGDFMGAARQRVAEWQGNYARGAEVLHPEVLERARKISGTWYVVIVAIDSCADSVNTVPYLAALADSVESIRLRVLLPDAGRPLQETRQTPDGRNATPTIIVMNENWEEVGSIIERPTVLLEAMAAWTAEGETDIRGRRMEWYRTDAGRSTVAELLSLMERSLR
jgi:hypothetical protein